MSLTVLLVEDDAASREFVADALRGGARVDAVRTLAEAGDRCAGCRYDLLLLDVGLPDGEGDAWLARQRALGNTSPAVALTADLDSDRRRRLLACGFEAALGKPISRPDLRLALRPWLGAPSWEDREALAAVGGAADTLARLRGLFLAELPQQRLRLGDALAAGDDESARRVLHQLKAGCAFVGARALATAVAALHAEPGSTEAARQVFLRIEQVLAEQA